MSSAEIRGPPEDRLRSTPVKRRRLLPLVDLRGPPSSPGIPDGPCGTLSRTSSLSGPVSVSMEISGSASLGPGRRPRPALTDLSKSGFCASVDSSDGLLGSKGRSPPIKISHLTGVNTNDDTVSRFPRLDQCAHFHYEYVELPPLQVCLVSEELKPLSQSTLPEDTENRALLVQVTSLGRSWVVRRTYENFRFLDKQLHRCCYDRKISQLPELPSEENIAGSSTEDAVENLLKSYLARLSAVAGSLITCGPVLSWLELDNRGHRLIVTDDSDINTPAVAAAYVIKRYTAQASDEISVEVGDMISVIDMPPPEESIWWRGKRGFQVGFFPCECVQVIEGKVPQGIHASSLTLPPAKTTNISPGSQIACSGTANEPMKPVLRKHGKLIAFFRSFILSRPPRPFLKRSGILRERVFGCDLAEHLLNSGHEIPMVLKCCSEFVETHGTVDGIYRLSGITSNIQKLRNAFDEERVPALYDDDSILQDIHCVSSLLKMYFRELPNPLLTYQLYDKFVQAVIQDEDKRLLHVRDVIQQLPPPHYRTLEYLIRHLARIASHSKSTNMTPTNIAIVWAPNLLRSKDLERGGVAALQDVGTQAVVTEYLIRYVDLIFNDKLATVPATYLESDDIVHKTKRPKSLAISTPVTLLSVNEARKRSLASIKCDQNYIDVGGGPGTLPKTYHTVINLPSRKGGSLKHKKSPSGWKQFFWKNKTPKKAQGSDGLLDISDPTVIDNDSFSYHKRLRPVKSVESLASTPASTHSSRNSQVLEQSESRNQRKSRSPDSRSGRKPVSDASSPMSSPRAHNRSASHDSYFSLIDRSIGDNTTTKTDQESDFDFSSSSPKMCLELKELNMNFDISENDVRIFSEDETLQSTSIDTNSRSTLDMEVLSMSSDRTKSKENICLRPRKSLKDQLKHPLHHRTKESRRSSSEDSRFLRKNLSPKSGASQFPERMATLATCDVKESMSDGSPVSKNASDSASFDDLDETPPRETMESALIDPELLERITRLRVTPAVSPNDSTSTSPVANANPLETSLPESSQPTSLPRPSNLSAFPPPSVASLASPETPHGDSTFVEIQYDPLSDTTEPSSSSEPPTGRSQKLENKPEKSSPLSPDISSSSLEDCAPEYENIEVKLSDSCLSLTDDSKVSSEAQTPVAPVEYELLEQTELTESTVKKNCSSPLPSYENLTFESDCSNPSRTPVGSHDAEYENIPESQPQNPLYENISFTEDSNYENCEFVSRDSTVEVPVDINGEIVYQQVKYLKQSIKEVNEILKDSDPKLRRRSVTKLTIHMAPKQSSDQQASGDTIPSVASQETADKSIDNPSSSECLDSPLTPSTSSLMTEIVALPSFSSPTFDEASLSELETIQSCQELPETSPSSVPAVLPSLSPSPESRSLSTAPVPLPRTLPISTNPIESPTSISLSTAVVPLQEVGNVSENFSTSQEKTPSAIVGTDDCHVRKESPVSEESSSLEPSSLPTESQGVETDAQRRERIEKYKEERRTFLRRNYDPNSFKGEKDDMILRLKQKATSPSRGNETDLSPKTFSKETEEKVSLEETVGETSTDENVPERTIPVSPIVSKVPTDFGNELKDCEVSGKSQSIDKPVIVDVKSKDEEEEINVKVRVAQWTRQQKDLSPSNGDQQTKITKENKVGSTSRKFTPPSNLKNSSSSSKISHLASTFSVSPSLVRAPMTSPEQCSTNAKGGKPPVLPNSSVSPYSCRPQLSPSRSASDTNVNRPHLMSQKSESSLPVKVAVTPTKKYSVGSSIESKTATKLINEAIGQDKIKAITAQFERESVANSAPKPIFLRQISK